MKQVYLTLAVWIAVFLVTGMAVFFSYQAYLEAYNGQNFFR